MIMLPPAPHRPIRISAGFAHAGAIIQPGPRMLIFAKAVVQRQSDRVGEKDQKMPDPRRGKCQAEQRDGGGAAAALRRFFRLLHALWGAGPCAPASRSISTRIPTIRSTWLM